MEVGEEFENFVIDAGQTWLTNMSIRCDDVEVLSKEASEFEFAFPFEDEVDVVVDMLERSFSTVCEEKYGSEKPCSKFSEKFLSDQE